jgi:hypothetical protein
MRYLSQEWKKAQWDAFMEEQIAGDTSDCGGWDGPCGGCARCMTQQFGYYMMKEEESARVFLNAGLDVAPPHFVTVPWSGNYHDSWRCFRAGEKTVGGFPWE